MEIELVPFCRSRAILHHSLQQINGFPSGSNFHVLYIANDWSVEPGGSKLPSCSPDPKNKASAWVTSKGNIRSKPASIKGWVGACGSKFDPPIYTSDRKKIYTSDRKKNFAPCEAKLNNDFQAVGAMYVWNV